MQLDAVLEIFGEQVQNKAKANLRKRDKHDTGKLIDTLKFEIKKSKNSLQFILYAEDYATFVDKGVKGKSSSAKAPSSPFQFGTGTGKKGGLTDGVNGWVQRKRIQFKDRNSGKFLSYKATAFLMIRSIYHKGLKTTNFLTAPFESEFKKLPKKLVEAYGLDMVKLLQQSLKNKK